LTRIQNEILAKPTSTFSRDLLRELLYGEHRERAFPARRSAKSIGSVSPSGTSVVGDHPLGTDRLPHKAAPAPKAPEPKWEFGASMHHCSKQVVQRFIPKTPTVRSHPAIIPLARRTPFEAAGKFSWLTSA
jgi:hypothetical protein